MNDHTWPTFLALWNQFDRLVRDERKKKSGRSPTLKQVLECAQIKSQAAARSNKCECVLHRLQNHPHLDRYGIYGGDQSEIKTSLSSARTKACLFLMLRWKYERILGRISNGRHGLATSQFVVIDNVRVLELKYRDVLPFLDYPGTGRSASTSAKQNKSPARDSNPRPQA